MAVEGGENGGGGGNLKEAGKPPYICRGGRVAGWVRFRGNWQGWDGGRPFFFSIIEGRGETWLVAERTYIEKAPSERGADLDTVDCSISHRLFASLARSRRERRRTDDRVVCALCKLFALRITAAAHRPTDTAGDSARASERVALSLAASSFTVPFMARPARVRRRR